jgi:hypothetical protein
MPNVRINSSRQGRYRGADEQRGATAEQTAVEVALELVTDEGGGNGAEKKPSSTAA